MGVVNRTGVRANPPASKVARSRRSTKNRPEKATQASVRSSLSNASGGVANYERRKWETRYEWVVECYDHSLFARRWRGITKPLPFEETLNLLIQNRLKYAEIRMRNLSTREVIPGEILT